MLNALVQLAKENRAEFLNEFMNWLPDNHHIWIAFVSETDKVIAAGFKHYSVRTIVHVIRHHSALVEQGSGWKVNNNVSPYLARLYALVYPARANLFSKRMTPQAERDNWLAVNNQKLF